MNLHTLFAVNFAPVVGMLFLLIFLGFNARLDRSIKRLFFLLLALEAAELIAYNVELVFAAQSSFSHWRTFLSAIGYSLRPILSYLVLKLTFRRRLPRTARILLLLPLALNILVSFSAFWTGVAYSYTPDNVFVRGPLGYFSHISVLLYLAILVGVTLSRLRKRNKLESLIIIATSSLILLSMAIEAIWLIRSIGRTAYVLSTVFYYMFFQTQEYQATLDEEARKQERLERQAQTDLSTGLLNKATFLSALNRTVGSQRTAPVTLIFFDLDHFKNLNDTLGHQTGDRALRDVAETLRRVFRKQDALGRFGGDEFCVLLQGILPERLSEKLEELRCALQRTYAQGEAEVHLTASIGAVVVEPGSAADAAHVLQTADAATYAVKSGDGDGYRIVTL